MTDPNNQSDGAPQLQPSAIDDALPTSIAEAYSPTLFGNLAAVFQETVTAHLSRVMQGDGRVLDWHAPEVLAKAATDLLKNGTRRSASNTNVESQTQLFTELLQQMLNTGQNLHHPHYIGHQVPASLPVAGLFDMVNSVINQPMAVYEMGPWGTAVEHAVVNRLLSKIGWNSQSSAGLLTSGGSLANLTALLTARNRVSAGSWQSGTPSDCVLLVQSDAHYCITRAAGILGLGTNSIRKIGLDDRRRMDPNQLQAAIREEQRRDRTILAVCAAACATPIGAFDPLPAIADLCEQNDIWLHVDAAHGGGALMSSRHRQLLDGIHRADSVVWDAHKMLFVPALCAAVFYRQKAHRYAAFQQDAPYLFGSSQPELSEWDSGLCTMECTKRALGFSLWGVWSMFGDSLFEHLVDRTFDLCRRLYNRLNEEPDFQTLHEPQCNILAFRYLPSSVRAQSLEQQNLFQQSLRTKLVRSGRFYVVQTTVDGTAALRTTFMNPLTTAEDLEELIIAIRQSA